MPFDWRQFHAANRPTGAVVDPRRRMAICLAVFLLALAIVFGRAVQLEVSEGAAFRAEALRPVEKETVLPASRGRILAGDGTVLACDETVRAVAVEYRWLQEPPDPRWLRSAARSRLPKADRKSAEKIAQQEAQLVAERADLAARLAELCRVSPHDWSARARRVQARVQRIAESANRRQEAEISDAADADESWAVYLRRLLLDDAAPPRIVVKEELAHHVMADNVPADALAEIRDHPERYPGTKLVEVTQRTYPCGTLAAHVLGHLGAAGENELVGRMGIERQCEDSLRGKPGLLVERTERRDRSVTFYRRGEPLPGGDVTLTLNVPLQRTAEELLRAALERRTMKPEGEAGGGAIVAMDLRDGAVLAAASSPCFDPNLFVRDRPDEVAALLADKSKAMFDRVCRMAIPPGSSFKLLSAVALLESATVRPSERFHCQGYLHQPDRQRCEIYVRQGIGHGDVNLADALAVSCNVYFFHFTSQMGPRPLVDWAGRFGFGRPTGIDLPGEAAGTLPQPESASNSLAARIAQTQLMGIGQGSLTATPLQMLRLVAAIATGGKLLVPHVVKSAETGALEDVPRLPLAPETLETIRDGLRRVVADPDGTAHATVHIESIAVAGKTGTAETGDGAAAHAWFVGYAPAEQPRVAFAIAIEHAGDAAAGPVAKRLVLRMEQLGLL